MIDREQPIPSVGNVKQRFPICFLVWFPEQNMILYEPIVFNSYLFDYYYYSNY